MKIRLTQKMAQKMALTLQMRQSIHILQLPLLELKTYLEQQMQENPILEGEQELEPKVPFQGIRPLTLTLSLKGRGDLVVQPPHPNSLPLRGRGNFQRSEQLAFP